VPKHLAEHFFPPSFHAQGRKTTVLIDFSRETLLARMLL
jgi:hypothetical protein